MPARGGGLVSIDVADYARARTMARNFSANLDRKLAAALRDAGRSGVEAVKARLGMVRVHGGPGLRRNARGRVDRHALRAKLQRNVRVQVRRTDVRVVQGAQGIRGANARGLPRRLDATNSFRHPAFGHDPWVTQRAWDRYFTGPLLAEKPDMTRRMERALADAVEQASRE